MREQQVSLIGHLELQEPSWQFYEAGLAGVDLTGGHGQSRKQLYTFGHGNQANGMESNMEMLVSQLPQTTQCQDQGGDPHLHCHQRILGTSWVRHTSVHFSVPSFTC